MFLILYQADYAKKRGKEAEAEFQKMVERCRVIVTQADKLKEEFPALNSKPSSSTAEGGVKPFLVPDLNVTLVEDEANYAKKHGKEAEDRFQKMVAYCHFIVTLADKLKEEFPALNSKPSSSTAEGGVKPFLVPDLNVTLVDQEDEAGESKANSKKRKVEATSGVGQDGDIMPI